MSKQEYLKGDSKYKVLDVIRFGLAIRCTNEEIIDLLKSKGFEISERTLRRFKGELHAKSGESAFQVFQKNVGANMLDDILSFEELERNCWKILNSSSTSNEKLKAISMLRMVKSEKYKILKAYPRGYQGMLTSDYSFPKQSNPEMELDELFKEIDKWTKN